MGLQASMVLGMLVSAEALTIANMLPKPTVRGVRAYNGVNMEAPSPPPPTGRLGATVDQDGKSNVWVSPTQPPHAPRPIILDPLGANDIRDRPSPPPHPTLTPAALGVNSLRLPPAP